MISTEPFTNSEAPYNVILISGDYWADHPLRNCNDRPIFGKPMDIQLELSKNPLGNQLNHFVD